MLLARSVCQMKSRARCKACGTVVDWLESRPKFSSSIAGASMVDTSERLARLRALMREQDFNVGAFVVPSEDEHFSEYPSEADQRRAFISGFNGSAGCAIVTLKDAFLFTDGRYFLQAEQQLDRNWTLMKQGLPDVPTWQEFLSKDLDQGTRVGIDPTLISASEALRLTKSLGHSELIPLLQNPVDIVWASDRPQRPTNKVFILDVKYTGETFSSKLQRVREEMAKKNAVAMAVTLLDEVAWLFNLRGTDIEFNPVFFAYAIVEEDSAILFINEAQVDDAVKTHFGQEVRIKPYEEFLPYLKGLTNSGLVRKEQPVLLGDKTSIAVVYVLGEENVAIVPSPVAAMKAIKNSTEIEGFRQCHIRDGAALARYFAWLEEQLNNGVVLSESEGADKLKEFRSELELFRGLSFTTISSTGPNAAIIHYSPDPKNCATITKDEYLDGTTDVTRTWHFGTPSEDEKRAFTRVLQGHIAIDSAIFPTGTTDSWARRALWQDGLDYRHGTGHGVGHFLNVHEGPQGIGTRIDPYPRPPTLTRARRAGVLRRRPWGIRIENVVVVREVDTRHNFGSAYLGFERLTMCPIQTTLLDTSLFTAEETAWLNAYHAEVACKGSAAAPRAGCAGAGVAREAASAAGTVYGLRVTVYHMLDTGHGRV
ncbi:peptidase M24, structural domain-containing protein [Melanogaster broomeanus]|nr:peptidase M24, structural domain-containing protein [Melanogaster broomeanus]